MQQYNATPTPMNANERLQVDADSGCVDTKRYRSLVGLLMYLTHTRSNIQFAVVVLSRQTKSGKLEGFFDSDWGVCMEDRKSITGVIFNIRLGAFFWISKKQDVIALSTTEAEYISLCSTACLGIWPNKVLIECG
ncbi:uncharacterized mitochondrial protein AtMg00810-like [Dioscorea cayenensis subsp. rotundata]|uniref:Uncharacterized mitochondrial protein AtMg00810-like n=1 Tax=Dioscorea cayennensis subsp. rotundata TaxID=55577 RepID=A0AB40CRM4_DIOCR|nr:uncharacterized mitochondrial protein AtMg00810-like [Dioscorea cayenensis subsp. rotundata]